MDGLKATSSFASVEGKVDDAAARSRAASAARAKKALPPMKNGGVTAGKGIAKPVESARSGVKAADSARGATPSKGGSSKPKPKLASTASKPGGAVSHR